MLSCKYCKSLIPDERAILFCPFCKEKVFNFNKETLQKQLKKVSIRRQTLLAIIPFFIFIAAYKIKKIRKSLIIYFGSIIGVIAIIFGIITLISFIGITNYFYQDVMAHPLQLLCIIGWLISSTIAVYYIRKWSKQWNNKVHLYSLLKK